MKLKIKKLTESAIIPKYQTAGSAGFDLHADENYVINPYSTKPISTGLAFDIPEGFELQIRPRSGLSVKTKLRVANSPGTIDSDYKSEVMVIMDNIGNLFQSIDKGDRIAQAVLVPVIQAEIIEVDNIEQTGRGGFGSTGN